MLDLCESQHQPKGSTPVAAEAAPSRPWMRTHRRRHGAAARAYLSLQLSRRLRSAARREGQNFRFSPKCLTDSASIRSDKTTMRILAVIFVLALITIAFEIYSDAALTSGEISQT